MGKQSEAKRYEETRKLPVELTDAEVRAKAEEAAHASAQTVPLKDEALELRRKIRSLDNHVTELLKAVERGEEERDVKCAWEVDWNGKSTRLIRLDTGEEVPGTERALTPEELQSEILFPPAEDHDAFGDTALDEEDDSPRYRAGDIPPKDKSDDTPDNLVNLKDAAKKKGAKKKSGAKGKKK